MSANNGGDAYVSIQELCEAVDDAVQQMSVRNPHRRLFEQCKVAIVYLAQRMPDAPAISKGGIILP